MIYLIAFLFNTLPWGLLFLVALGLLFLVNRARIVARDAALDFIQVKAAYAAQQQDAALLILNVNRARLQLSANRHALLAAMDDEVRR